MKQSDVFRENAENCAQLAEAARDELLALNAPACLASAASAVNDSKTIAPSPSEPVAFGRLARLYVDGYLARRNYVAEPTRQKEEFYIREYLLPEWGMQLAGKIQSKAVEDWLHTAFEAWWTRHGVRGIMNRIYRHAEGHGLWPEGRPNPAGKAQPRCPALRI